MAINYVYPEYEILRNADRCIGLPRLREAMRQ